MDGIGGSVKRYVWNKVLSRQCIATNAESFVAACKSMEKVTVREVKTDDIAKRNKALNLEVVFSHAAAVPNIGKKPFLEVLNGDVVSHVLTRDRLFGSDDVGGPS